MLASADQETPQSAVGSILEMRGIKKAFPGVQALGGVDFSVRPGEVMALVGENGAGKSTLIRVLAGVHHADAGEMFIDGQPVRFTDPKQAIKAGIAVIYQELNLAEKLTVAENIFVGREPRTSYGAVDFAKMRRDTQLLLDRLQVVVDPSREVRRLSVARKQMVEIAKALSLNARIIVMDEPTSSLTENEVDVLLNLIRRLRSEGVAIVYVSHRMEEIFRISDRVTVFRDGRLLGVRTTSATTPDEIVSMMVGRKLEDFYGRPREHELGRVVLEVRHLSQRGRLHDISLSVRAGEIVGLAGLVGAGRTEVARALFGADKKDQCEVLVDGKAVQINSPQEAIRAGLGYLPEDRKLQALFLGLAVRANITAACTETISRAGFLEFRKERETTAHFINALNIRTPSAEQRVRNLSGGNQQKVVLAKWLAVDPKVLILDEPTRGVDVGAKQEIYGLMHELAGRGIGIIMISSELPEILGMSDRIVVLREGRLMGELSRAEASEESVMALATGTAVADARELPQVDGPTDTGATGLEQRRIEQATIGTAQKSSDDTDS
jgi:ribose transport system ATP-binding protein